MCARYFLSSSAEILSARFQINIPFLLQANYNICPSLEIPILLNEDDTIAKEGIWGFLPSWARKKPDFKPLINARSETACEKPSFRSAMKRGRCLIPADGFFEWKTIEKAKQPFCFRMREEDPFLFAGLYEKFVDSEGSEEIRCLILTTEANDLMKDVHHRMPVILESQDYAAWLDTSYQNQEEIKKLMVPLASKKMSFYPVSKELNKVGNNHEKLVQKIQLEIPPSFSQPGLTKAKK